MALEHAVHFFQGRTLCFREAEPDPDDAGGEEYGEEDICAPGPCREHGGHEEGDGKIVDL